MQENVAVSLVQFASVALEPGLNAERMADAVLAEGGRGAELVVFPELSTTGYVSSARDDAYARRLYAASETVPGPSTERLAGAARQAGVHVVVGVSQRHPRIPDLLYNAAVLIDPAGDIVGIQHKVHACRDEKEYYVPGDRVATFATALGRIGLQLCYDVRFPELARVQALDGAEMIFSLWAAAVQPGHVPTDSIVARCATRAMENALFFAGCNRSGTDNGQEFFGGSAVAAPDGSTLAAADADHEEAIRATLVADRLSAQRRYLTLFRDRRPELYGPITAPLSDPATTAPTRAAT